MPTLGNYVERLFREKLSLEETKKQHYALTRGIPRFLMNQTGCSQEDAQDILGHATEKLIVAAWDAVEKQTPAYFRVVLHSSVATVLGKKHRKAEVPCSMDPDNDPDADHVQPGLVQSFMAISGEERKIADLGFDLRIIGEKLIEGVRKTGDPDVICFCEMLVLVVSDNPLGNFKTLQQDTRELMRQRTGWSMKRLRNAILRTSRNPQFKTYQSQREQLRDSFPEQGTGE